MLRTNVAALTTWLRGRVVSVRKALVGTNSLNICCYKYCNNPVVGAGIQSSNWRRCRGAKRLVITFLLAHSLFLFVAIYLTAFNYLKRTKKLDYLLLVVLFFILVNVQPAIDVEEYEIN